MKSFLFPSDSQTGVDQQHAVLLLLMTWIQGSRFQGSYRPPHDHSKVGIYDES